MGTNPLFKTDTAPETQAIYEELIIQAIQARGNDVFYVPRQVNNLDSFFGEDIASSFTTSFGIEMYVETAEGFEGQDLFQKFGVEVRDDVTFVVSKSRWNTVVGTPMNYIRPREGDLVYAPFAKALFEINEVMHEEPFYQLGQLPVYKLYCSLFKYNDEVIDIGEDSGFTGSNFTGTQQLTMAAARAFQEGEELEQLVGTTTVTGRVVSVSGVNVVVGNISSDSETLTLFTAGPISGNVSNLTGTVASVATYDAIYGENDIIEAEADVFAPFDPNRPFGDF